jgi:prefoldin subunit 5
MTSEDIIRVKRGPADLEERIDQLQKQKEILKSACKKAGARIKELERDREILKKEIDRLAEENNNFERMLRK